MERNVEAQIFDDFCLEAVVLVFGAVSLTTLGFIAINSHSVLAGGELGLQQVSEEEMSRSMTLSRSSSQFSSSAFCCEQG
mmetsp:Transcript_35059/g.109560  ORF Transcript_35059/g.109560 Transcript_35059/m.109560 type:complete len:80 (-) Transcript_35059:1288-1527(-)